MGNIKFRIGGVPEHFNLPIHLAIKKGLFEQQGLDVEWTNYPGGTGAMCQALRAGEQEACVLLTEGIITDIIKGNPSKIISGYVKSPLIWGIHTAHFQNHIDRLSIFKKKIAISRPGSGSHLMPIVDALVKDYSIKDSQFKEIGNLEGAIQSLSNDETQVFYWEKFTTNPYVQSGQLKRIGEFISPWPCFMIAAGNETIRRYPKELDALLKVIHQSCEAFMLDPQSTVSVSKHYHIDRKDAEYWFHSTEWATNSWVSDKVLTSVTFALKEAGIIFDTPDIAHLIWQRDNP